MRAEDLKPGAVIEWPHTPDFTVVARLIVDRTEDGYAWLHHEHTDTINRLSIPAILRHARLAQTAPIDLEPLPAEDDEVTEAELWWALAFIIVVILVIIVYYGKN